MNDVVNELNLYWGPSNVTVNDTERVNDTMDETEGVNDTVDDDTGRIRIKKAHPIWGITMLTIPFIPIMIGCPMFALILTQDCWSCIRIPTVLLSILLFLPFSAVATPIYILLVCGFGICQIIRPTDRSKLKEVHGMLKTAEI